jgi:hypothetical protein
MRIALVVQHATPLCPRAGSGPDSDDIGLSELTRRFANHGHQVTVYARSLGRDGPLGGRRVGRPPLTSPGSLPVFGRGTAPYAVALVLRERELKAFLPHPAPRADHLGPRDLLVRSAGP